MKAFMAKAILTANGRCVCVGVDCRLMCLRCLFRCVDGVIPQVGGVAPPPKADSSAEVNSAMLLEMREMAKEREAKKEKKVHIDLEASVKVCFVHGLWIAFGLLRLSAFL